MCGHVFGSWMVRSFPSCVNLLDGLLCCFEG